MKTKKSQQGFEKKQNKRMGNDSLIFKLQFSGVFATHSSPRDKGGEGGEAPSNKNAQGGGVGGGNALRRAAVAARKSKSAL
jgi:hypothetical protein